MSTDFQYSRLPTGHIRLLHLTHGLSTDPLSCELEASPLGTGPPQEYEALSYCWGTGALSEHVVCNDGGVVRVSENLKRALLRLRYRNRKRTLWIDQICINQTDTDEKAVQLPMMGQIYRSANEVLVWLGDQDGGTALAFDIIRNVVEAASKSHSLHGAYEAGSDSAWPQSFDMDLRKTYRSPHWEEYRQLLQRPWFTRAWAFQELVLSRKAQIMCGRWSLQWHLLVIAHHAIQKRSNMVLFGSDRLLHDSSAIGDLELARAFTNRDQHIGSKFDFDGVSLSFDLLSVVRTLRGRQATDPRDKIYAAMGIANDLDDALPPVDYEQPFEATYTAFTKWFIHRYRDLSVLSLVAVNDAGMGTPVSSPGLPSWVPDLREIDTLNNGRVENGPATPPHGASRLYSATGLTRTILEPNSRSDAELAVQAIFIGTIQVLGGPAGNIARGTLGPNTLEGGQWSILAERCAVNGIYPPTGEPIQRAFQRLRVCDFIEDEGIGPRKDDLGYEMRTQLPDPLPPPGFVLREDPTTRRQYYDETLSSKVLAKTLLCTERQKFYITDTGFMGLAHQSCVLGDKVALLLGGDMPFVLQERSKGRYTFKGQSYVHGVMDGEYLLRLRPPRGVDSNLDDKEWLASLGDGCLPFQTDAVILT